jgi:hypothetical protein
MVFIIDENPPTVFLPIRIQSWVAVVLSFYRRFQPYRQISVHTPFAILPPIIARSRYLIESMELVSHRRGVRNSVGKCAAFDGQLATEIFALYSKRFDALNIRKKKTARPNPIPAKLYCYARSP